MRISNRQQRRDGNVLVLFALLLFVIFAVGALTIDMGLARLSQRQMQGATDAAALEGLRYRDEVPAWLADPNSATFQHLQQEIGVDPSDQANRDQVRRWMARNQVNLTFTNGVDPATGDPVQYGAGPDFQLSGGVGEGNALQTLHMPQAGDITVYKPNVQLNNNNAQAGDLVAGNFDPTMSAKEDANYNRLDFPPLSAGDSLTATSFLVRLRRTQDTQGNDRNSLDNQPNISTTGKALPLLFGQGSLIAGGDPTVGYSPRHHGITVRGTAIAKTQPARSVGAAYPATLFSAAVPNFQGMRGAAPFALDVTTWNATTVGTALAVTTNAAGQLLVGATPIGQMIRVANLTGAIASADTTINVSSFAGFPNAATFRVRIDDELLRVNAGFGSTAWTVDRGIENTQAAAHALNAIAILQDAIAAGQTLAAIASPQPADLTLFTGSSFHAYVPVYDPSIGQIVGFGQVQWIATAADKLQITTQPGIVASENATTIFVVPPTGLPTIAVTNALLAPALAR
jgi:hypothetical protein